MKILQWHLSKAMPFRGSFSLQGKIAVHEISSALSTKFPFFSFNHQTLPMKSIRSLSLILLASFVYSNSGATHLRAGDITVARVGCTDRFIITLHVYTRVSPSVTVKFGGGTLAFGDGTSTTTESVPFSQVIAQVSDGGVGEVTYNVEHTYPGSGSYNITYYEQNRNLGVLNMVNSVDTPFFIQTQ